MKKVDILFEQKKAALTEYYSYTNDRINIADIAAREARLKAEADWDAKNLNKMNEAKRKAGELEELWEEERIQDIANNLPYPEGMIFTVWNTVKEGYYKIIKGNKKLYNVRLEVVRKDSKFLPNLKRYNRPDIGSVIGRRIKKDGSLSVKYEDIFEYNKKLKVNVTVAEEEIEAVR